MKDWLPYPRNRKYLKKDGYTIVVPNDYAGNAGMPMFCDVCELRFINKEDEKSYKKFKCCSSCADMWAFSHAAEWKNGWRPSKEQIEENVRKRSFVNPSLAFE